MPKVPLESRHQKVLEEGPILTRGVLIRDMELLGWAARLGTTAFTSQYLNALEKICANPETRMGFKVKFQIIIACDVGDSIRRSFTKIIDLETGEIFSTKSQLSKWVGNAAYGGYRHNLLDCKGPEKEIVNMAAGSLLETLRPTQ
jgi:hypothetical protein